MKIPRRLALRRKDQGSRRKSSTSTTTPEELLRLSIERLKEETQKLLADLSYQKLVENGNKVHILYWDVKPLIKNLGSGTVDVLTAFLGNNEAAQIYGKVLNQDTAKTLRNLFRKFISGEELKLFNNEIKGISAISWTFQFVVDFWSCLW